MTEEQKKKKAERDRRYREKKKAEKAAESDLQSPSVMLQQQPIFEWQAPPPCVVEGHPDDLPPVKIEPETITYFDVYKRRHEGMFK